MWIGFTSLFKKRYPQMPMNPIMSQITLTNLQASEKNLGVFLLHISCNLPRLAVAYSDFTNEKLRTNRTRKNNMEKNELVKCQNLSQNVLKFLKSIHTKYTLINHYITSVTNLFPNIIVNHVVGNESMILFDLLSLNKWTFPSKRIVKEQIFKASISSLNVLRVFNN